MLHFRYSTKEFLIKKVWCQFAMFFILFFVSCLFSLWIVLWFKRQNELIHSIFDFLIKIYRPVLSSYAKTNSYFAYLTKIKSMFSILLMKYYILNALSHQYIHVFEKFISTILLLQKGWHLVISLGVVLKLWVAF